MVFSIHFFPACHTAKCRLLDSGFSSTAIASRASCNHFCCCTVHSKPPTIRGETRREECKSTSLPRSTSTSTGQIRRAHHDLHNVYSPRPELDQQIQRKNNIAKTVSNLQPCMPTLTQNMHPKRRRCRRLRVWRRLFQNKHFS